jgi:hypothetical protein
MTRYGVAAAGLAVACGTLAADRIPLKIPLPPPVLSGTPVPVRVENLEPADVAARRDPVMVPENTVNVALNKPVTSSEEWPIIGELEFVTDGYKEGDEGNYVELGPKLQWVQIDLERPCNIYAVAVWHFFSQERAYHDVIIQTSNDPSFEAGVKTHFNNDHDNSSGMGIGKEMAYLETNRGRVVPVDGGVARYVRLYSRGNTSSEMNHYIEVEVYGVPAE